jgi:Family of unknown function (DUF5715)
MLNLASRFEENAEAHLPLLRPLAIFFVIALALAATSRQPVQAASREHTPRHSASAKIQPQSARTVHAHATAPHKAGTRSRTARNADRHEQTTERPVSSRGRRRVANPGRRFFASRNIRNRNTSLETVAASRAATAPMARPIAGASSLVEAAPTAMSASGDSHSAEGDRVSTAPASDPVVNATVSLSAGEMAQAAVAPRVFPMYTRAGRLIVPPPLRGSREILVHQNEMADAAGLERIENDEELDRLRYTHQLIDFAGTSALHINPELPENRRSARPWTAKFASDIARAYYARFGQPLELNSAVRTISYQLRLQRVNGNAAAIEGETASPHLTGQAIDFGKKGMTTAEIAWMRMYLTPLMQAGMIDVEEEFQQACFHISVYRSYAGTRPADVAQVHGAPGSLASASDPER